MYSIYIYYCHYYCLLLLFSTPMGDASVTSLLVYLILCKWWDLPNYVSRCYAYATPMPPQWGDVCIFADNATPNNTTSNTNNNTNTTDTTTNNT